MVMIGVRVWGRKAVSPYIIQIFRIDCLRARWFDVARHGKRYIPYK